MREFSIEKLAKKRPRERPIRRLAPVVALVVSTTSFLPPIVHAQTNAFTRQVDCPSDSTITGYTSIAAINADMAAEVARIVEGGTPEERYGLNLCPGTFDATGGNSLRPVLDQVTISCGDGSRGVDSTCIIDGSREQLVIEDPPNTDYILSSVTIEGLIFSGLSRGDAAVSLDASAPTQFTCRECVWQNFEETEYVVDVSGSMTFILQDGVVQTTLDRPTNAQVNEAVFNVGQGNFLVEGLLVDGITTNRDIVKASGSGSIVKLVDTTFTDNVVESNLVAADEGALVEMTRVDVEANERLSTGFFASDGATMLLSNVTFLNNVQAQAWDGIVASSGGKIFVGDSLLQGNQGLQFGILSKGVQGQGVGTVNIERTDFVNNVGFNDPDNGPKAVVATFGDGAGNPFLNLERVEFEGNSGFISNFMTLMGGQIIMQQACFAGNSNTLIGFEGKGGQSTVFSDNFIDDNEGSLGCAAEDSRLGIEPDSSDGCFTEASQGNCQVNCGGPIADSDICLSEIELSESPTLSPVPSSSPSASTDQPTTSPAPSLSPSIIDTDAPSRAPSSSQSDAPSQSSQSDIPSRSETPSRSDFPTINGAANETVSGVPSMAPSLAPSPVPSSVPSIKETERPTLSPLPTTTPAPTSVSPAPSTFPTSILPPFTLSHIFRPGYEDKRPRITSSPSSENRRSRLSKKFKRSKRSSDKEKLSRSSSRSGKGKGRDSSSSGDSGKGKGSSSYHNDDDGTIDEAHVLGVWGAATDNMDRLSNLMREEDVVGENGAQRKLREFIEVTIDPEMKNDWYGFHHGVQQE